MERPVVECSQLVGPELGLGASVTLLAEHVDVPAPVPAPVAEPAAGANNPVAIRCLVASVVLLGVVSTVAMAAVLPDRGLDARPVVIALLLALTTLGEATAVRLRHGDSVEELTLFEAAVVVDVLLLPPVTAVVVSVVALATASAVRRRPPLKSAFNLGSHAASTALLVGVFHAVGDPGRPVAVRSVVGLLLGTLGFAAVNLLTLARVLALVEGVQARVIVIEGWRLSATMALGNAAVGSVAVALARSAPALLPFSALPALALTIAYRAAAQEADERDRSSRVLELTASLARRQGADEHLHSFLSTARRMFRTAEARVVLDGPSGPEVVVADDLGVRRSAPTDGDLALLVHAGPVGAASVTSGLPAGWDAALVAPLEAEGIRLGVVAFPSPSDRMATGNARLLTPLASALAVALRGAAHLADLEEERTKLQAVIDHSSDGMMVLDEDGRVLVWNPAMAALTGVSAEAAHGSAATTLLVVTDAEGSVVPSSSALPQLTTEEPRVAREHGLLRTDGEQRWVSCSHAGIFGDEGVLQRDVVVVHDITRERQVDRLKADFVATVTHELRTPMTPIKGYTDLLRRRGSAMTEDKRAECLDVIADRVAHLNRLIEDLLLASRVSSPVKAKLDVQTSPQDLGRIARRAVADFAVDGGRITVATPDQPVLANCDPTRAIQVLGNLVSNAAKFSPPDAPVEVTVTEHDGHAAITVVDRGRGIPADQLNRIFDKFVRLEDPMTMTTGGTGLGLFIARELVEAMHGTIAVHSALGSGSTFVVTLPLAGLNPADDGVPIPRSAPQDCPTDVPN